MSEGQITKYGDFLFDIKAMPLEGDEMFTTHFYIFRDNPSGPEPMTKGAMGNRCSTENEALLAGLLEAKRFVDEFN